MSGLSFKRELVLLRIATGLGTTDGYFLPFTIANVLNLLKLIFGIFSLSLFGVKAGTLALLPRAAEGV